MVLRAWGQGHGALVLQVPQESASLTRGTWANRPQAEPGPDPAPSPAQTASGPKETSVYSPGRTDRCAAAGKDHKQGAQSEDNEMYFK